MQHLMAHLMCFVTLCLSAITTHKRIRQLYHCLLFVVRFLELYMLFYDILFVLLCRNIVMILR